MANPFTSDAAVQQLLQENLLQHKFLAPLKTDLLYRGLYNRKPWLNRAWSAVQTKTGHMTPKLSTLAFKTDPITGSFDHEQFVVAIADHADRLESDLRQDQIGLAPILERDLGRLGSSAARTLNLLGRYPVVNAAVAGQTVVSSDSSGTSVAVDSINGFTKKRATGYALEQAISVGNPLAVYLRHGGAWVTLSVTAVTPDTAGDEFGPGTLTLSGAQAVTAGDLLVSETASYRIYSAGTVGTVYGTNDLDTTCTLTLKDIRLAVARLRQQGVPTFEDGYYHCHLSPNAMSQLMSDAEFRSINRGLGLRAEDISNPYVMGTVDVALGVAFIVNPWAAPESFPATIGAGGDYLAAPANNGLVSVETTIICGSTRDEEGLVEYDLPRFPVSDWGMNGKVGEWAISGDAGVAMEADGIDLVLRAPIDALQRVVSSAWQWAGTFSVATDYLNEFRGGPGFGLVGNSAYKRVVAINHVG